MRQPLRLIVLTATAVTLSLPLAAQTTTREGVMGELLKDVAQAETKVLGLARAMPDAAYAWRPAPGVRSTGETLLHIAADNYFLPILLGAVAPAETGITKEFSTTAAFEKRTLDKAAVVAELEKSFAFLRTSMAATTDAQLDQAVEFFGQKNTRRGVWILTATHLHEHLGQLIAYARSNQVTPPWSK